MNKYLCVTGLPCAKTGCAKARASGGANGDEQEFFAAQVHYFALEQRVQGLAQYARAARVRRFANADVGGAGNALDWSVAGVSLH